MTRRVLATAVIALSAAVVGSAQPPAANATEYEVKAAYLYSFGKFVQWPAGPRRGLPTFELCVIGPDPFGSALDRVIAGAAIGGRGVTARRLPSAAAADGCHVVFVGGSDGQVSDVLAALSRADVLTVGDTAQFLDRGGMIRFVTQGGRVRFEVNLARAQAVGLALSSDLLRVASNVRREGSR